MQKNYNLITLGRAQREKVKRNGQKSGVKKGKAAARYSMLSSSLPPF